MREIRNDRHLYSSTQQTQIMTIAEVSQWLTIKEKTIRQWIYQEKIPSLKINGVVRFDRKELSQWILKSARGQYS